MLALDLTIRSIISGLRRCGDTVFEYISDAWNSCRQSQNLISVYTHEGQSGHFTVMRPSREYRAERFGKLLNHHSILTPGHLDRILEVYDDTLANNLALTTGAENALKSARKKGWGIFVVSEGPHVPQETTLERTGVRNISIPLLHILSGSFFQNRTVFLAGRWKNGRAQNEDS